MNEKLKIQHEKFMVIYIRLQIAYYLFCFYIYLKKLKSDWKKIFHVEFFIIH